MRLGDSSREQSNTIANMPSLTQHFVHPDVSPSSIATPSATPHDTMSDLAPGQKDKFGRLMIELDGSSWHPVKDVARCLITLRIYSGKRPDWMLPHVFDELDQYWNTDKFKAISD
ncbi:hypothetical protein H5410_045371 [Solanum commersonii]|uniref:Uncharacterized protein n=1 Tax=Solanum commersonii TaxID=4109 RepID=A0A9J5X9D5_SOLCO|nr:hypothetical protein H5410_045371 [Solanum commersonii]